MNGNQVTVFLDQASTSPVAVLVGYLVSQLDLYGGTGNEQFLIGMAEQGSALVNVHAHRDAAQTNQNVLTINGTNLPDNFLLRHDLVATLSHDAQGQPQIQRINYDMNISAGLNVNSLDGDDVFSIDDNSAVTTIHGNAGADKFQIGQMFKSARDLAHANVPAIDAFSTTLTTRGFLSNGVSYTTTIEGDSGNDEFTVYRNLAQLNLHGGDGDDYFTIRAFALEGSQTSSLQAGAGADHVEYALNSNVDIAGGDGSDTVLVIGTEFGDSFVLTYDAVSGKYEITGAGVNVTYSGIEKLSLDGAEGNDTFYVEATDPTVQTFLYGGLGIDTFIIGGDIPQLLSGSTVLFPATPGNHTMAGIASKLLVLDGASSPSYRVGLVPPVMLPGETNSRPAQGTALAYTGTGLSNTLDTMDIDGANLGLVPDNLLENQITDPLNQLVGKTVEIASGAGRERFYLIRNVVSLGSQHYRLTLQNAAQPDRAGRSPSPEAALRSRTCLPTSSSMKPNRSTRPRSTTTRPRAKWPSSPIRTTPPTPRVTTAWFRPCSRV